MEIAGILVLKGLWTYFGIEVGDELNDLAEIHWEWRVA